MGPSRRFADAHKMKINRFYKQALDGSGFINESDLIESKKSQKIELNLKGKT